jgi:hypothetical protein
MNNLKPRPTLRLESWKFPPWQLPQWSRVKHPQMWKPRAR